MAERFGIYRGIVWDDPEAAGMPPFDFDRAYTADGWGAGIAWRAEGYETRPDADTEWTGYEVPTGAILAHMVGDDSWHAFDPDDLTPLAEEDYCRGCGQVGCGWC